jgi:hypothetical protein
VLVKQLQALILAVVIIIIIIIITTTTTTTTTIRLDLVRKPVGKRPLGRLRRRWEDNIRMDLREI